MVDVLNITEKVISDDSIISWDYHEHQAYTQKFNNNDEIRIPIAEDLCTLPSQSYIYVEGKVLDKDGTVSKDTKLVNNFFSHCLSEIRYEVNGIPVDSTIKPGLATTAKGYCSFTENDLKGLENSGWGKEFTDKNHGTFNICVPLNTLLGFAEDYKKIMLNVRQELVLIRSNTDHDAVLNVTTGAEPKIVFDKIYWNVPHITPNLARELALTKYIAKNVDTTVAFRSWEMHYLPSVPQTRSHTWPIKTTTASEAPRYVILMFQTDREKKFNKDMSKFDHISFQNIRVYLNSQRKPYSNLNIDFGSNCYAALYQLYLNFQKSYYYQEASHPALNTDEFKNSPMIVIDFSNQRESLSNSVVLRIEFDTKDPVPANTAAYALILHDRRFTYNAFTKQIKQI